MTIYKWATGEVAAAGMQPMSMEILVDTTTGYSITIQPTKIQTPFSGRFLTVAAPWGWVVTARG